MESVLDERPRSPIIILPERLAYTDHVLPKR